MKTKRHPLLLAICDWNGTILDDLGLVYASIEIIFKKYNIPVPSLAAYQNEITVDFMKFYYTHGIPSSVTSADTNAIRQSYFEKRWDEACLQRNAIEFFVLLEQLHLFTGIVSAEIDVILKKRLEQFEIAPYFDKVIGGVENKEKALRDMLNEFNFLPEEAVYVDDTYDGLKAAKNVGILPIGVTHGYHACERIRVAQPDERYVGNSFHDIQRIIEREVRNRNR